MVTGASPQCLRVFAHLHGLVGLQSLTASEPRHTNTTQTHVGRFECNDKDVKPINFTEVQKVEEAYLLFYCKTKVEKAGTAAAASV